MSITEASSPRPNGPVDDRPTLRTRLVRARLAFRYWRWRRPFWAGLLTVLAGLPIAWFPYANLTMGELTIRIATTAGAGSLVIGVLLITLGLGMWLQPATRVFAGVATIMLSLVSLVVSNFGGFVVGFLLGLIGGGLSIAWAPGEEDDGDGTEEVDAAQTSGSADGRGAAVGPTGDGSAPAIGDEPMIRMSPPAPGTGSALDGFGRDPAGSPTDTASTGTGVLPGTPEGFGDREERSRER
ncbi:hypothetical protein GCM10027160_39570 [Streptomyces calidiresistens]|uniref:DUF6114 domain-containing protein n=1 Tax=Streptomyces calidiresistens TaxID=1485586 RepID=UPI001E434238|nr:DUF6114 domain-containing protein [Streptomyces calidiresistens]